MTEPRRCILVLGMHRSGTSAITRVLNLMGAALPRHMLGANPSNEAGHWESELLVKLNDDLLSETGSRWDDWRALSLERLDAERCRALQSRAGEILREEYAEAPSFVLKDPRICRMVPFYAGVLRALGIATRHVLIVRNPVAVARSLAQRDAMTEDYAALLWLRHVLDAEQATRGQPRCIVSYEALLSDWREVVRRLSEALALGWEAPSAEAATSVTAFLRRELQHHAPDASELGVRSGIWASIRDAYAALLDLERDADDDSAHARLDSVRAQIDGSQSQLWDTLFGELEARRALATARLRRVPTPAQSNARPQKIGSEGIAKHSWLTPKRRSICYVTATRNGDRPILDPSSRYRCYHFAEALRAEGHPVSVQSLHAFLQDPDLTYDTYVFHRPSTANSRFPAVIEALKRLRKVLVADYDDLIFGDAQLASQSSIVKNGVLPLDTAVDLFANNQEALSHFEKVTASTAPLADMAQRFNPNCRTQVFANTIPPSVFAIARVTEPHRSKRASKNIGYFSGTLSHNRDFPVAYEALYKLLMEDPEVHFWVTGPLTVEGPLKDHPRAHFSSHVNYWRLPHAMSRCHCVIAPLEESTFNQCKSRVKYLEASLAGCQLIASPIDDMSRIRAPNLHLANDASEWYDRLTACVSRDWSAAEAENAFSVMVENNATEKLTPAYYEFLAGS